ncbi:MAG: HAMP domain-containing histidine kinase [Flavobacteriales bacterium]|nr:HAMP domain-containing histidine kinase [Flavobacteriales bacterium]
MKRGITLPLFWKFTIAIVIIVSAFGFINLYFLSTYVSDLFEKELSDQNLVMTKTIADRSVEPILYNDLAALNKIVSDVKQNDKNIAYAFILDPHNHVLAHTFENKVPTNLINLKNPEKFKIIELKFQDSISKSIKDISVPILEGSVGMVRVGIYNDTYVKTVNVAKSFFLSLVILFLISGIIGAFIFSYVITKPIKFLSQAAKNLNLEDFKINPLKKRKSELLIKWNNRLKVYDEIDDLYLTFDNMINRLEKAYKEIQIAQKSLMQSEKIAAIGTLSAGLAHEINNPIAGIKNCMRRLSENPENLKQNITYLEMMQEAVFKIEKVVGNLLNFTRIPKMEFYDFNLITVVENVLLLTSFQLEKSRITVIKNYDIGKNRCFGSQNHIEQVVLNLLLNSIDAINEKKMDNPDFNGQINIHLFLQDSFMVLELKDNGIGIEPLKLKSIFDPFFTQKKVKQGTGLGLSVSFNIIKEHEGKIEANINESEGMTFSVFLPLK